MDGLYEQYLNRLKDAQYKLTKPRKVILETLLENRDEHPSTEEILTFVQEKDNSIGIATVYRTMIILEELGIVYKLDFGDGFSRYELNEESLKHHHHHLICLNCNKVIEVKVDLLDELEEQIEQTEEFSIVDHNLKFYGYCKDCKEKGD